MRLNRIVTAGAAALAACSALGMAHDAATGNVVLFGGSGGHLSSFFGDTWTWDGSTWTQQHPATHPTARSAASMAYDAATGNVVLFGGKNSFGAFVRGTWTWDGSRRRQPERGH